MPTCTNPAPLAGLALRCQPDSRLAALSREGQPRAFEEIVRRYRQRLVAFAGAIVPAHRAEDVVQEAFAKAHAALAAGDTEVKLKPWLYTIVRNRALNDLRDEPVHEHLDESFDGVAQPPDIAARHEQLRALIAQLKDLPRTQREALVRRELEGRGHHEIAVALGVTPGAVRALIYRARTALRDGAGMLIPMPALRALLNAGPLHAEAAGTGIGGAAAGLTAAGGGGIAVKAGTTLAIAVLAVGSGIALDEPAGTRGSTAAAAVHRDAGRPARGGVNRSGVVDPSHRSDRQEGSSGPGGRDSGSGEGSGDGSSGPDTEGDDASEDGGDLLEGGSGGDDRSGSGSGGGEHEGSSGPTTGGHEGHGGSGGGEEGGTSRTGHEGSSGGGGDEGSGSSGSDDETNDGTSSGDGDGEPQDDGADSPTPPGEHSDG